MSKCNLEDLETYVIEVLYSSVNYLGGVILKLRLIGMEKTSLLCSTHCPSLPSPCSVWFPLMSKEFINDKGNDMTCMMMCMCDEVANSYDDVLVLS